MVLMSMSEPMPAAPGPPNSLMNVKDESPGAICRAAGQSGAGDGERRAAAARGWRGRWR